MERKHMCDSKLLKQLSNVEEHFNGFLYILLGKMAQ